MSKNSTPRWETAEGSAYHWVQKADQIYVAARFLYWKGFPWEFALLGAHAMELYLKAFLIHKTHKYPKTHDVSVIYKECMKHEDFFKDETLRRHFLPLKPPLPDYQATWINYSDILRYPESLPRSPRPRPRGAGVIIGAGGTCQTLDCIAHFVREAIPRLAEIRDVLDDLVNGDGYIWSMDPFGNLPEIRRAFLQENQYFGS
ncbi:MAG: HEPN domain-containing protein [Promethearchaeati archaeon]